MAPSKLCAARATPLLALAAAALCARVAHAACNGAQLLGSSSASVSAGSTQYWTFSSADTVTLMVSSDDGSNLEVFTRDSSSSSLYYTGASSSGSFSSCLTAGPVTVKSCPGSLAVGIKCNNLFFSCPVKYSITGSARNSCSPPTQTPTPSPPPSSNNNPTPTPSPPPSSNNNPTPSPPPSSNNNPTPSPPPSSSNNNNNSPAPASSGGICPSTSRDTSSLSCNLGFSVTGALPSGMQPVMATTVNQDSPANGETCYRMSVSCNGAFAGALNTGAAVAGSAGPLASAINAAMQAIYNQVCPPPLQNQQVVFYFSDSALDPSNVIGAALSIYNAIPFVNDYAMCDIVSLADQAFQLAGANVPILACNTDNCNFVINNQASAAHRARGAAAVVALAAGAAAAAALL